LKARRTNTHSKLALQRLSSLLIGEIVPSSTTITIPNNEGKLTQFDPMEYRRYALTNIQLVSVQSAQPVYRLRFCSLFPTDSRTHQQIIVLPGQYYEIMCRVRNEYVTRYYTPIRNTPISFEIIVKLRPQGKLTPFLVKQKIGDRQFKIRGPIGTPVIHPSALSVSSNGQMLPLVHGLPHGDIWETDRSLFISAGSGVATALQAIHLTLFAKRVPMYVFQTYDATQEDEITVTEGDYVWVDKHLWNGWAYGTNLSTQRQGFFPLPVTLPTYLTSKRECKLALINTMRTPGDAIGSELLNAALLSYPHYLKVSHFLTRGSAMFKDDEKALRCPGNLYDGRIDSDGFVKAVEEMGWDDDLKLAKENPGRLKVFVTGPAAFQGVVCDILCKYSIIFA
jgi:NAD(P)H-flavin reductase